MAKKKLKEEKLELDEEVAEEVASSEDSSEEVDLRTAPIDKVWELYPKLDHLTGNMRLQLEERVRLRKVRYKLFRLQTQIEKGAPIEEVEDLLPGFVEFWLNEVPQYSLDPKKLKQPVPENKLCPVKDLGGFKSFAKVWDVDHDLKVYLRHSSVWQEWNATLHRVVPILGE